MTGTATRPITPQAQNADRMIIYTTSITLTVKDNYTITGTATRSVTVN